MSFRSPVNHLTSCAAVARAFILLVLAASLAGCWWDNEERRLKIVTEPADTTVNVGATASFEVAAKGKQLKYQWRRDGVDIPGATSARYTTPATVAGDNGARFSARISSGSRTLTTREALLTVIGVPVITGQPAATAVLLGATASFSVTATGAPPLAYQWRRDGVNIAGATAATYTTPATVAGDSGATFSVVVSNGSGTATSGNAVLTVNIPAAITSQPTAATVVAGATASFSVTATGTAPLNYQWRRNGTNIAGATAASYTTPATVTGDNGAAFSVIVSNAFGTITSADAVLTVSSAPVAGTWGAAQLLELVDTTSVDVPLHAAINRSTGDGVVVWTQVVNGAYEVLANRYSRSADAWSGATSVARAGLGPNSERMFDPRAAIDAAGNIVVVWSQTRNEVTLGVTVQTAQYARYSVTGTPAWIAPVTISRIPGGPGPNIRGISSVEVAMDAAGNAVIAWLEAYESIAGEYAVATRLAATGGAPPAATQIDLASADASGRNLQVAVDNLGNAVVVWERRLSTDANRGITVSRSLAGEAGWSTPVAITASTSTARDVAIAIDPATGRALVAWAQDNGTAYDIRAARYGATDGLLSTVGLVDTAAGGAGFPRVAINSSGDAAISWQQSNGTADDIYVARLPAATTTLTAPVLVDQSSNDATTAYVGLDDAGNAMLVWTEFTPGASVDDLARQRRQSPDGSFASGASSIGGIGASVVFAMVASANDGTSIAGIQAGGSIISSYGAVFR